MYTEEQLQTIYNCVETAYLSGAVFDVSTAASILRAISYAPASHSKLVAVTVQRVNEMVPAEN